MEKGWIEFSLSFLEPGIKFCTKWQCSIFFLHKLKLRNHHLRPFKQKNPVAQWRRVDINFETGRKLCGENSVQNGNVQLFCYINSYCVFSKTIWKTLLNGDWRTDGTDKKDPWNSRESWNSGKLTCVFSKTIPLWGEISQPVVSRWACSLAIQVDFSTYKYAQQISWSEICEQFNNNS